MYVFSTSRMRVVVSHGAIGIQATKALVSPVRQVINDIQDGTTRRIELTPTVVDELEWSDYDDVPESISSGRPRVARHFADEFMQGVDARMHIGGHQDYVEAFGVLASEKVSIGEFWRTSPAYAKSSTVPLLVARHMCGDADECPPLASSMGVRLSASHEHPLIVKTSICYTGKPTVTGATYVSTRRLSSMPGEKPPREAPRVASPCDTGVYAYSFRRRPPTHRDTRRASWSCDEIIAFTVHDWNREIEELPVLFGKEAIRGYEEDALRRIDAPTLVDLVQRFEKAQPNDGDGLRVVRDDGATILFVGDIHSNIHALVDVISSLHGRGMISLELILRPGTILVLMGDYGHRGPYGILVYSLIMTLKIKNPDHVFLTRGNHERMRMWHHYRAHGLLTELKHMRTWRAEKFVQTLVKLPRSRSL